MMKQVLAAPTRTVIQIVLVEWSKKSRGGPLATQRNRVPLASALQARGFDASEALWIETQNWSEPDFTRPRRVVRGSQSGEFSLFQLSNLAIAHMENTTRIAGALCLGAPYPRRYIPVRYELQAGQFAKLRWNARTVDSDGLWSYHLIALNIARVVGEVAPDIFTSRPPDYEFESLRMLR
jgi:hypothetical protein